MVGAAAAWTPASLGSTEEPVPGIPCLPGGPRFLSKRECPLELRLPFLPLNLEQMGFMLGFLLHVQNFPPEARGHRVQKGVRCPWEPPQGGLAGERAWLEFKDVTLGIKGTSHQGASELSVWRKCRQSSRQLLPKETLPPWTNGGAAVPAAQEAAPVSRLRKKLLRTPEACVPPWTN